MALIPRKSAGRPDKMTADRTFNNSYEEIYQDFANGERTIVIAEKYNVSRQAAHLWKRSWLAFMEFDDEPPKITAMKKKAETEVLYKYSTNVIKEEHLKKAISRKSMDIDKLRIRGLGITNKILDKMETLIDKEKSIGGLAKALAAILPYVATKQDGDSDKGLTPDEKRMAFVKNVMNVYNINVKQEKDESTEDDFTDWDPEE
jgi:hypothetical protein